MSFNLTFLFSLLFLSFPVVYGELKYKAHHDPEVLILFFCFGLILGGITTFLITRFAPNLPYTVVMFLLGAALAAIVSYYSFFLLLLLPSSPYYYYS